jgi:hypothetical protein
MDPARNHTGAEKMGTFWYQFAAFLVKNGSKTAKKGPKSVGSSYLSVNYVFLYSTHSLLLT